jgi:hypothetical protein
VRARSAASRAVARYSRSSAVKTAWPRICGSIPLAAGPCQRSSATPIRSTARRHGSLAAQACVTSSRSGARSQCRVTVPRWVWAAPATNHIVVATSSVGGPSLIRTPPSKPRKGRHDSTRRCSPDPRSPSGHYRDAASPFSRSHPSRSADHPSVVGFVGTHQEVFPGRGTRDRMVATGSRTPGWLPDSSGAEPTMATNASVGGVRGPLAAGATPFPLASPRASENPTCGTRTTALPQNELVQRADGCAPNEAFRGNCCKQFPFETRPYEIVTTVAHQY